VWSECSVSHGPIGCTLVCLSVCPLCLAQEGPEVQQLREDFAELQSECAMLRAAVEEKEETVRQLKADILRLDYKTETERVGLYNLECVLCVTLGCQPYTHHSRRSCVI